MREQFDDILKRRWEEKQFPVDDNHRSEMEKLLDGKDNRKAFPFYWMAGVVLLLAVGGFFFINENSQQSPIGSPHSAVNGQQPVVSREPSIVSAQSSTLSKESTDSIQQSEGSSVARQSANGTNDSQQSSVGSVQSSVSIRQSTDAEAKSKHLNAEKNNAKMQTTNPSPPISSNESLNEDISNTSSISGIESSNEALETRFPFSSCACRTS